MAYLGEVQFAGGTDWVGVRLTGASAGRGKNDGSVAGVRYFEAGTGCGVFVRERQVEARPARGPEQTSPVGRTSLQRAAGRGISSPPPPPALASRRRRPGGRGGRRRRRRPRGRHRWDGPPSRGRQPRALPPLPPPLLPPAPVPETAQRRLRRGGRGHRRRPGGRHRRGGGRQRRDAPPPRGRSGWEAAGTGRVACWKAATAPATGGTPSLTPAGARACGPPLGRNRPPSPSPPPESPPRTAERRPRRRDGPRRPRLPLCRPCWASRLPPGRTSSGASPRRSSGSQRSRRSWVGSRTGKAPVDLHRTVPQTLRGGQNRSDHCQERAGGDSCCASRWRARDRPPRDCASREACPRHSVGRPHR